jgi:hypothetical protein
MLLLLATPVFAQAVNAAQVVSPTQPAELAEIHVDGHCRILAQERPDSTQPYDKPQYRLGHDEGICQFDGGRAHITARMEENIVNGVVKRTPVTIREHTYLLHNPTQGPITFVIQEFVPSGWTIDSDPQPNAFANSTATFRVFAEAGQTVRLHVGRRR